MPSLIAHCLRNAYRTDPAAASQEAAEIVGFYIADNTKLNRVFQAAERICISPTPANLEALRQEVANAKQP